MAVPSHVSSTSHDVAAGRHGVPRPETVQIPRFSPAQVWQEPGRPPPHALSQQTPSAQKPLAHVAPLVHASPSACARS